MNNHIPSMSEVLTGIAEMRSQGDKVKALQDVNHVVLRNLLICMYDPTVKILLPEGTPPYKPSASHEQQGALWREGRKLKYFVEGQGGEQVQPMKRESIYINLLESIDPHDAELMIQMVSKKPIKGLTAETINKAFGPIISKKEVVKRAKTAAKSPAKPKRKVTRKKAS